MKEQWFKFIRRKAIKSRKGLRIFLRPICRCCESKENKVNRYKRFMKCSIEIKWLYSNEGMNRLMEKTLTQEVIEQSQMAKKGSRKLAGLSAEAQNNTLLQRAEAVREERGSIFSANRNDVKRAQEQGIPE